MDDICKECNLAIALVSMAFVFFVFCDLFLIAFASCLFNLGRLKAFAGALHFMFYGVRFHVKII